MVHHAPSDIAAIQSELEFFGTALDDCFFPGDSQEVNPRKILALLEIYHDYSRQRSKAGQRHPRAPELSATPSLDPFAEDGNIRDHQLHAAQLGSHPWELEAQTWDLLKMLLPARYTFLACDQSDNSTEDAHEFPSTTAQASWTSFLRRSPPSRELHQILQWLRKAHSGPSPDLDRRGMSSWLHTKSALKHQRRLTMDVPTHQGGESRDHDFITPLVSELDPDAASRQSRSISPEDISLDRAHIIGCAQFLRQGGSLADLRQWCYDHHEVWRLVSFLPHFVSQPGSPSLDPSSLYIWRQMCLIACNNRDYDDSERALYGILAGDFSSVEKVSQTWHDLVYANCNAALWSQFENDLVAHHLPASLIDASTRFSKSSTSKQHPFNIKSLPNKLLDNREETFKRISSPVSALQAAIIFDDLDRYLYNQGLILSVHTHYPSTKVPSRAEIGDVDLRKFASLTDRSTLRMFTHVYYILAFLDQIALTTSGSRYISLGSDASRGQIQGNLLATYTDLLHSASMEGIIPLYCSPLSKSRAYDVLGSHLLDVSSSARVTNLRLIQKARLDATAFVQSQVGQVLDELKDTIPGDRRLQSFEILQDKTKSQEIWSLVKPDFFGEDPDSLDPLHKKLISSMEWLLLVDEARCTALHVGVEFYKRLLNHGQLNAARSFMMRVPFSDVRRQPREYSDELEPGAFEAAELDSSIEKRAIDAEIFRECECLVKALDSIETLASLVQLVKESLHQRREFWMRVEAELKTLKSLMRSLLECWVAKDIPIDDHMARLRRTYMPETVLAYISLLQFGGTFLSTDNLMEGMELAYMIASTPKVALTFSRTRRTLELIKSLGSCSKILTISRPNGPRGREEHVRGKR